MILGIGSDITDSRRIDEVLNRHGERFTHRCFSQTERMRIEAGKAHNAVQAEAYARRWAVKEACAKALGIGIARGVFLKDIETVHDAQGKPSIRLSGGAKEHLEQLTPPGMMAHIHLSVSDEPPYALAFVVISCLPA